MSREKRPKLSSDQPDDPPVAETAKGSRTALEASKTPTCDAYCYKLGQKWVNYSTSLTWYENGPLKDRLLPCWVAFSYGIRSTAESMLALGLAPWGELAPATRERLMTWSPVAKQLWESEFEGHKEALVRAWIWHYLDDNFLSFSGGGAPDSALIVFSSPVWAHIRTLRRDLDVLRTRRGHHYPFDDSAYRAQFHGWCRMTESMVRRGLGLDELAPAEYLMAHFRESLRRLLSDGQTKLEDLDTDSDFNDPGDPAVIIHPVQYTINSVVGRAPRLQWMLHGLELGSYNVRFTPIDSDKLWGFDLDEESMTLENASEVPDAVTDGESPTHVTLVSDPMLVVSGPDGLSYEKKFTVLAPMIVVPPWAFGADKAEEDVIPRQELGSEDCDKAAMPVELGSDGTEPSSGAEVCQGAAAAGEVGKETNTIIMDLGSGDADADSEVKMRKGVKVHDGVGEHEGAEGNEGSEGNEGLEAKKASEGAGEVCEVCEVYEVCEGAVGCRSLNEWEHTVPR